MEENKIPTAEEFCKNRGILEINTNTQTYNINADIEAFIEFAKLHVKEALKAASENASLNYEADDGGFNLSFQEGDYVINKDSILNSYPESNIK